MKLTKKPDSYEINRIIFEKAQRFLASLRLRGEMFTAKAQRRKVLLREIMILLIS